eukprot:TRINITY_DN4770_c0_g1_i3.p1 TRINITY_DN4770_c0_g1~~TRINITY_DN4770_c0_g1_i3.p1  ORF type:complete len:338 (-),score=57.67 TRINITY_DN4770_c0_g1_i3:124-1089(-)
MCIRDRTLITLVFATANQLSLLSQIRSLLTEAPESTTLLSLLSDLRQLLLQEQEAAEATNITEEEKASSTLTELVTIAEQNKDTAQECTARREKVEDEFESARQYLTWMNYRSDELSALGQELRYRRDQTHAFFKEELQKLEQCLEAIDSVRQSLMEEEYQLESLIGKLQLFVDVFGAETDLNLLEVTEPESVMQNLETLEKIARSKIDSLLARERIDKEEYDVWNKNADSERSQFAKKLVFTDNLSNEVEIAQTQESKCIANYEASLAAVIDFKSELERKRHSYAENAERRTKEIEILAEATSSFPERNHLVRDYLQDLP